MSYVRHKDKRTGITYVYESESYWDKEKQQPRARRTLIGKIDEATGEIVPTDGRGRKRKPQAKGTAAPAPVMPVPDVPGEPSGIQDVIREKDALIQKLTLENEELRNEKAAFLTALNDLAAGYMSE